MKKVLVGGCFNSIHPGHIYFLKKSKEIGDYLIVVIANDIHNKKPYAVPQENRKASLEKMGIADKVVIGNEKDFSAVVRKEKPDIIALGYDQKLLGKTRKEAEKMKIKIVRIGKFGEHSTRKLHSS